MDKRVATENEGDVANDIDDELESKSDISDLNSFSSPVGDIGDSPLNFPNVKAHDPSGAYRLKNGDPQHALKPKKH